MTLGEIMLEKLEEAEFVEIVCGFTILMIATIVVLALFIILLIV